MVTLFEEWLRFSREQRRIEKELDTCLRAEVCDGGLTYQEFLILSYLATCPDKIANQQAMESYVGLTQSALSRAINKMRAKSCGVIEKIDNPEDKRSHFIRLTAKGSVIQAKALTVVNRVLDENFKTHLEEK
ncbi:DNA-binding MarR family transcriptional regulator [Weissella soli]|uniref:DNA-binding MarR family transcriptional regulator n=1 Tax=Weissella soli TaxID=155866 RepID=A0A288Q8X8_9LACO|nr:hypothetical protein WSWS_00653 [Weissella soli]RDL11864.1 DNA-binding MarR family transcriptional regulator [Weissella soli]